MMFIKPIEIHEILALQISILIQQRVSFVPCIYLPLPSLPLPACHSALPTSKPEWERTNESKRSRHFSIISDHKLAGRRETIGFGAVPPNCVPSRLGSTLLANTRSFCWKYLSVTGDSLSKLATLVQALVRIRFSCSCVRGCSFRAMRMGCSPADSEQISLSQLVQFLPVPTRFEFLVNPRFPLCPCPS